jgi:hypothetical protein
MVTKYVLLFILFIFVTGLVFAADQESQNYVAVRITNQSGNPINDVAPDMFGLQLDKTSATVNSIAQTESRRFVVLLDLAFSSPEGILAARRAVSGFLASLPPKDAAAIAVYDLKNSFRLLCGFSSDRTQWNSALNHLDRKPEETDSTGMFLSPDANQPPETTLVEDAAVQASFSTFAVELKKDKVKAATDQFASRLSEFAKMLNVVYGQKVVLLFSPGVPAAKGGDSSDFSEPDREMITSGADEPPELSESKIGRGSGPDKEAADAFVQSGSILYAFDLSGLGKPVAAGKDLLKQLAKSTHGNYFDDLGKGLEQVKAVPSGFTLLGWRAASTPQRVQELKITNSQNLKLEYRDWVLTAKALPEQNPLERKLYLSQWYFTRVESSKLEHSEFIDSFPAGDKLVKTVFFLQIPGKQILDSKSKSRSYYVGGIVSDSQGRITDSIFSPIRINTDKVFDKLKNAGIKYTDVLLSPSGELHFNGILIDFEADEVATFSFPFQVADFHELTMTHPFFACANKDWISIHHDYPDDTKRGIKVEYPYSTQDALFFPELSPAFSNGVNGYLFYSIFNLSMGSANAPDPHIRFVMNPAKGDPKVLGDFKTIARIPMGGNNFGLLYEIKLGDFAPGNYQLTASFGDGISQKVVSNNVSVRIQQ